MNPSHPVRILSIDGGGIRGIIPALILARIEKLTRRPAATLLIWLPELPPAASSRSA